MGGDCEGTLRSPRPGPYRVGHVGEPSPVSTCVLCLRLVDDSSRRPLVPEPDYDANGVDRTLVRYVLAMSPAERVRTHDLLLADIEKLEAAGRAARDVRA